VKIVALLLICLVAYCLPFLISDQLTSREDLIFKHFSAHLAETGRIGYRSPGDTAFLGRGFVPRCFIYRRGETVPPVYPGFILLWAGARKYIPWPFSRLINPMLATLALFFFYLIARFQSGERREALRATIILATAPVFVYYTYLYRPVMLNLTFFLAGLYLLLLALRKGRVLEYLFFGTAAGLFLWLQPANPIYLAGLFIFFLLEKRNVKVGLFLTGVAPIVLLGAALLIFNRAFYGGFFPPGAAEPSGGSTTGAAFCQRFFDFLKADPRTAVLKLLNAPLSLSSGFPLLLLAAIGFFLPRRSETGPRFAVFCCCFFFFTLLFFAGGNGEKVYLAIDSSFLRNLLPALALLPLLVIRTTSRLDFFPATCFSILVAFNLLIGLLGPGSISQAVIESRNFEKCRSFLMDRIEPNGVVFSAYWDKLVFPERTVYGSGDRRTGEELAVAAEEVFRQEREIITTSHPRDQKVLSGFRKHFQLEEIRGPEQAELLSSSPEGKQLKLYKVRGENSEEIETGPFLPTITRFPEETDY